MRIPAWPLLHGPLSRRAVGEALLRRLRRSPRLLVGGAARDARAVDAALAIAETVFPIGDRRDGLANDALQARRFDVGSASKITAPVLVVHGTRDRNVPYRHATHAMHSFPHARLVAVPGANHWTTAGDPPAAAVLAAFLADLADGGRPRS